MGKYKFECETVEICNTKIKKKGYLEVWEKCKYCKDFSGSRTD